MDQVNRIAGQFNADGSIKAKSDIKTDASDQAPVSANKSDAKKIHSAPLNENVAARLSDLKNRFDRLLKEEPSNDLDNGIAVEKTQGQRTVEAFMAELSEANRIVIEGQLGNRNILDIEDAVSDAPKLVSDMASYAKNNPELRKLFADEDVKSSVLNLIAHEQSSSLIKKAYANSDKDSQIKIDNLTQAVNPVQDALKLFSAKGAVYFEELTKVFKPFLEQYAKVIDVNVEDVAKLLKEKAPELKEKFVETSPADVLKLVNKLEELAPQLTEIVKKQSHTIADLISNWMKNNMKPVLGFALNGIAAVKTVLKDVINTVPGAKVAPTAKELEAQTA